MKDDGRSYANCIEAVNHCLASLGSEWRVSETAIHTRGGLRAAGARPETQLRLDPPRGYVSRLDEPSSCSLVIDWRSRSLEIIEAGDKACGLAVAFRTELDDLWYGRFAKLQWP